MQAMRRSGHSAHLLLVPAVYLPLPSQHHSSALSSPKRYAVGSSWALEVCEETMRRGGRHPVGRIRYMLLYVVSNVLGLGVSGRDAQDVGYGLPRMQLLVLLR
jgi:hypothetical protein